MNNRLVFTNIAFPLATYPSRGRVGRGILADATIDIDKSHAYAVNPGWVNYGEGAPAESPQSSDSSSSSVRRS